MLHAKTIDFKKDKTEILVVPVCADTCLFHQVDLAELDQIAKKHKEFKGKSKEELLLYHPAGSKAERLLFIGLGKIEAVNAESLRRCAGAAVKIGLNKKLSTLTLAVPDAEKLPLNQAGIISALAEGAYLANHRFHVYKSEKKDPPLKQIQLLTAEADLKETKRRLQQVESICAGTCLARDWVSMPPNDKPPLRLAETMADQARKHNLRVTVMNEKELLRQGFGAMLAVSAGSRNPPCLMILEYRADKAKKTIALVGKGVTFDSGGINLKPAGSLEDMKMDMAGAAAVAATMLTVAKLKPDLNVIAAMPMVENMPSGTATRPGDIIKSLAGKTIEIANTDAEGRLILIDAMTFVLKKFKPDLLLDLATLTGACVIALGEKIAGLFSNDDELAQMLLAAGEETNERCWRLPLPEDYKELLKSDAADLKNVTGARWGGAVTAALFLSEFIGKTKWAHLDIAGPAFLKKADAYCSPGGTGFGVRLLCRLLEKIK